MLARYDVLVVGGGPAALGTAIAANLQGLRAAIVRRRGASARLLGEAFHPGAGVVFSRLGILAEVCAASQVRPSGQWVRWGDTASFQAFGADEFGPWLGFHLMRPAFENILLARVENLGIEIFDAASQIDLIEDAGRVAGVRIDGRSIASRYTVDASGSNTWLGRRMQLKYRVESPRLVAFYGTLDEYMACDARLEATDSGWRWAGRMQSNIVAWTQLVLPGNLAAAPFRAARGAPVAWKALHKPAGPGYFVAGDAAVTLDPLSGKGVLRALITGIQVVHAIASIAAGRSGERSALEAYTGWLHALFENEVIKLRDVYREAGIPMPTC